MLPGSLTGVLRDLAANPGSFAREFSLSGGAETDSPRSFVGPGEVAAEERDAQKSSVAEERRAGKSGSAARRAGSASGFNERFAMIAAESDHASALPEHFRRRGEALPGTYDRSGRLAPGETMDASQTSRTPGPASLAPKAEEQSLYRAQDVEPVRQAGEELASAPANPPWLRRAQQAPSPGNTRALTAVDESVIRDLKKLEREILNREMEQARAGGGVSGKSRHVVETGPDGARYITDGTSTPSIVHGGPPEQELKRARAVRRAALAPSSPSAQDLSVASEARRVETRAEHKVEAARAELQRERELGPSPSLETLQSLLAQEDAASSRRSELRDEEARRGTRRALARSGLSVAEIEDPTIDNPEVVTLQRQFAMEAYLEQL